MKKILFLLTCFSVLTCSLFAQNLNLELGTKRTTLGQTAINLGIEYAKSLDSIFDSQDIAVYGKHSFFLITPNLKVYTGTADAFSSITAKMEGLFTTFKTTTTEDGFRSADLTKTFHTFPISLGAETNNQFSAINGIFEGGWAPWIQSGILKPVQFGLFIQAGYKFDGARKNMNVGGAVDESAEPIRSSILRAKSSVKINTPAFITINGFKVGLVGRGDGWYDLLHSKTYYRIDGRARIYLTETRFFDFVYEKGSGAPNFNEGEQWGLTLSVKL